MGNTQLSCRDCSAQFLFGILYLAVMGMAGAVTVYMTLSTSTFAENCGTTTTYITTVFVAQAFGALLAAIAAVWLYKWFYGNWLLTIGLLTMGAISFAAPFVTSIIGLHVLYGIFGLCVTLIEIGCQILTTRIFGISHATSWLSANFAFYTIGSMMAVMIDLWLIDDVERDFISLGSFSMAFAILTIIVPHPEKVLDQMIVNYGAYAYLYATNGDPHRAVQSQETNRRHREGTDSVPTDGGTDSGGRISGGDEANVYGGMVMDKPQRPHFIVEIAISIILAAVVGGLTAMTALLETYTEDMSLEDTYVEENQMFVFWIMIAVGRILVIFIQPCLSLESITFHLYLVLISGTLILTLPLIFQQSILVLWITLIGYGLTNGPTLAYAYQFLTYGTLADEKAMAMTIFGLNLGIAGIPLSASLMWDNGIGPTALFITCAAATAVSVPCVSLIHYYTYMPLANIAPSIRGYAQIPNNDPDW